MLNDKVLFKGTGKADMNIEMNTRRIVEQYKKRNDWINRIRETKQLQFVGNSMCPVLDPAKISTLFLSFCNEYRVGDIVAFEYKHSLMGVSVHRIIKKNRDTVLTKGDNNLQCDEAIGISCIIGKVERVLTNESIIAPIITSKPIAILSRIENRIVKWLPNRVSCSLHKILTKIYILIS